MEESTPHQVMPNGLLKVEHGGGKIKEKYNLATNTHNFDAPDDISEVIKHTNVGNYPDQTGGAISSFYASSLGLEPEQVVVDNGSSAIFRLIASAFLDKTASILVLSPTYSEYERASSVIVRSKAWSSGYATLFWKGSGIDRFETKAEDDWKIHVRNYCNRILERKHTVVWLPNPVNPTGVALQESELIQVAEACEKAGSLLVIDSAYQDMSDIHDVDTLSLVRRFNNVVITHSTKQFKLLGVRLGIAYTSKRIGALLTSIKDPWSVNSFAEAISFKLLNQTVYLENIRTHLKEERRYFYNQMAMAPSCRAFKTSCNFCLIELPVAGSIARDYLSEHHSVRIRAFDSNIEPSLKNFIRVSFQSNQATDALVEGLTALK